MFFVVLRETLFFINIFEFETSKYYLLVYATWRGWDGGVRGRRRPLDLTKNLDLHLKISLACLAHNSNSTIWMKLALCIILVF